MTIPRRGPWRPSGVAPGSPGAADRRVEGMDGERSLAWSRAPPLPRGQSSATSSASLACPAGDDGVDLDPRPDRRDRRARRCPRRRWVEVAAGVQRDELEAVPCDGAETGDGRAAKLVRLRDLASVRVPDGRPAGPDRSANVRSRSASTAIRATFASTDAVGSKASAAATLSPTLRVTIVVTSTPGVSVPASPAADAATASLTSTMTWRAPAPATAWAMSDTDTATAGR